MRRNRVDYEALFAEIVNKMEQRPRASSDAKRKTSRKSSTFLKITVALGAILIIIALVFRQPQAAKRVGADAAVSADGVSLADRKIIGNIKNWKTAKPSDLSLNFAGWLRRYGVEPASKIELDATGNGQSSGSAYLFVTDKTPGIKRVIWIVDHKAVYDTVGKIQGMAKIPREGMTHISWGENGAPVETADGDGLLLIRDYTSPNGTTVFFIKNGKLCSGIPADITNLAIR